MDKRIQIKEEHPLTDDIASQNEREFHHEFVYVKTSIDTYCDVTVKTEIKSETSCVKHLIKNIKTESAMCSNNWEKHRETETEYQTLFSDFGSQNEREFLPENPLMLDKEYNNDHEMYNKIEIKEEPWFLETESSLLCDNIKDGNLPPEKSSRLYPETVACAPNDKSPLLSAEVTARDASFCKGMNHLEYEYKRCDVLTAKKYVPSNQYGKCNDEADIYILPSNVDVPSDQYGKCNEEADTYTLPSNLNHSSVSDMSKTRQQCSICQKSFSLPSDLKAHILNHEGNKKTHRCKACDKSFTDLSNLKTHYLTHNVKKSHQCKVCNKSFTQLSNFKRHKLVHEGKRPHQCKVCDKSFTHLSNLKTHNLTHEGKKPHECIVCNRSFTQLSNLKRHSLVHEGQKLHQCRVCNRSFTDLSILKTHALVHEGKKPHQCNVCDKSFTKLSHLKTHTLVHEGVKPHQCKVCDKSFTQLSHLKRHNLVHEGKKSC